MASFNNAGLDELHLPGTYGIDNEASLRHKRVSKGSFQVLNGEMVRNKVANVVAEEYETQDDSVLELDHEKSDIIFPQRHVSPIET